MRELWDVFDQNRNLTGRFHERGRPMKKGDHHLIIQVWILNSEGKFLITKRVPSKSVWANLWHTTGGCAVAGDGSLKTALKETREEIGIILDPQNGQLFKSYSQPHDSDDGSAFYDVWLFKQKIDLSAIVYQPDEICGAKWAGKQEILRLIDEGAFFPTSEYTYLDELFAFCKL
ncbi:MAG: NUDIX domain-containing protein [Clostridiaceae bacterium]